VVKLEILAAESLGVRGLCCRVEAEGAACRERADDLMRLLGSRFRVAEGETDGILRFSPPVRHGEGEARLRGVMLTRIDLGGRVFVHASDIQLMQESTIDFILLWALCSSTQ